MTETIIRRSKCFASNFLSVDSINWLITAAPRTKCQTFCCFSFLNWIKFFVFLFLYIFFNFTSHLQISPQALRHGDGHHLSFSEILKTVCLVKLLIDGLYELLMKTVISWSPSFGESSSWNRFSLAHSNRRVSHTGSKINHREFGSFLRSTHTYGWSIWSGWNAVLIKITLLLCHTWQCWEYVPLPHLTQKNKQTGEQLMYNPLVSFSLRGKVKSLWKRV